MASVGNGQTGRTLIGTGVTSSPTFASIGTLSGLTQFGVILGGGSGAFTSTSAGAAGYVLTSSGPGSAPVFLPRLYLAYQLLLEIRAEQFHLLREILTLSGQEAQQFLGQEAH